LLDRNQEILGISRLLPPKYQADLLTWVHVANTAENSVRKSMSFNVQADNVPSIKSQEYFCEKSTQRRKK